MPWGTPDTIPAGTVTNVLQVPDGELWDAIVTGALYELTLAQNFQQIGALTPEQVSERFLDMWEDYLMGLVNLSLADIAIYSTTTPQQTFQLNPDTQLTFEKADGDDIAIFHEADKGVQFLGRGAFGPNSDVENPGQLLFEGTVVNATLDLAEEFGDVSAEQLNLISGQMLINATEGNEFGYISAFDLNATVASGNTQNYGSLYAMAGAFNHRGSGNIQSLTGVLYSARNRSSGYVGIVTGAEISARNQGTGDVDILIGMSTSINNVNAAGAVNNGYGLLVNPLQNNGTMANGYGIKIEDQAGATNTWALKTGVGKVEFGDIINFAGTMGNSTKNPATDAPADWVQIQIGGTTLFVPAYAPS